jgi:hypothetical protein
MCVSMATSTQTRLGNYRRATSASTGSILSHGCQLRGQYPAGPSTTGFDPLQSFAKVRSRASRLWLPADAANANGTTCTPSAISRSVLHRTVEAPASHYSRLPERKSGVARDSPRIGHLVNGRKEKDRPVRSKDRLDPPRSVGPFAEGREQG